MPRSYSEFLVGIFFLRGVRLCPNCSLTQLSFLDGVVTMQYNKKIKECKRDIEKVSSSESALKREEKRNLCIVWMNC